MRKPARNVHCYTACFDMPVYAMGRLAHVSRTQYHIDSQIAFLPGPITSEPRGAARAAPNRGGQATAPQRSVAATPHTRQPQAPRSARSRPQARTTTVTERGKQPSADRMETSGRRDKVKHEEGAGGFVDTTPGPVTNIQSSCEQRPQRQADRSVVATPSTAAPASANCRIVSRPVSLARCGSIRLARLLGLHAHHGCRGAPGLSRDATAARRTSAGLLGHGIAPGLEGRAPALAQVQQAQKVLLILPFPGPTSMTERQLTVTQHFQALHDMTTWSDMELKDDKAASLFDSLDRVWIITHREKLTSPLFAENLKTFLLIRGGIAPSSPEAVPVIAHVKALTRMRLRLLEERGPGYGRDKKNGRQVTSNLQQINTPAEATSSAGSERRGATVSAVNMQTTRRTRSGWLAEIRTHSRRHDEGRPNLSSSLVLSDTKSAVESRDMSHHQSHGAARLLYLVPLMRGWSLSLPLSLLFQKTSATVHDWLASHGLTCECSATLCGQDGIEQVAASPTHGPRGPAPADAEGPAAQTDSHRTLSLHARADRLTLTEHFLPEPSTSQTLLVVFHTARGNKVVARAEMPSPSAKLKAARRLPKRLRTSGEAPDGDLARMRDEAAERYERGESSSSTLHSCLQKTHKGWTDRHPDWWLDSHWSWHGQWTTSWSSGYDWAEGAQAERQHLRRSGASPSSARPSSDQPPVDEPDSHTDRPLPPTPPTPRRHKKEPLAKPKEDGASHGGSAKGETIKVMAAVKSKPRSTRNRSKGTSPRTNAAATGVASGAGSQAGEAGDAVASQPLSRSLAQEAVGRPDQPDMKPPATAIALEGRESATSRCSNPDRPETTAENARQERRQVRSSTLSNDSDDVEIIQSDRSQPEMLAGSHPKESTASGSQAKASASTGPSREDRPGASKWTQEDTKLSKAMSRPLRHKSKLKLDEAGYAKLSDMLEHPRLGDLNPTKEWMMHIVQHNFKQRFALNEAGTHIRAKQGHSIKVDPSKLLRQLGTEDIGDMIPTCALHSTYLSNAQSIMQRGLMPGGTRGTSYRQHVHLAISDRPEAGLREGSDLILTVSLMRAQSAGCVFLHQRQQCRADSRLHSSNLYSQCQTHEHWSSF